MLVWKITEAKPLLSSILTFLLSPLNSNKQSYTKFLQLKSTNKNAQNFIYKIKSTKLNFSQPVKALSIPLCCTVTKIRLLYISKN